jgi:hypothetical protein
VKAALLIFLTASQTSKVWTNLVDKTTPHYYEDAQVVNLNTKYLQLQLGSLERPYSEPKKLKPKRIYQ